jgi:predicted MPP superfamily phosphohydrolase
MFIVSFMILLLSSYCLFILPTQWLKIERVRYPIGLNKKILQISDLHVEMLRVTPQRLKKIVETENPDYIFLTGDFTRYERYLLLVDEYLKMLKQTEVPMYAVLGNHDYRIRKQSRLLGVLHTNKVEVLRNESLSLPDFQLVGIDDYDSGKSNIVQSFKKVNGNTPIIIITHDPNVIPKINHSFHYLMCGHLHGKQFNIPFFFKFKNKGELPSRGVYKGLHKTANGVFYISKGIGQAGINARLFVRSEITMHYL